VTGDGIELDDDIGNEVEEEEIYSEIAIVSNNTIDW